MASVSVSWAPDMVGGDLQCEMHTRLCSRDRVYLYLSRSSALCAICLTNEIFV